MNVPHPRLAQPAAWPANSIPPDETPTRFELRSEVRRLVQLAAHAANGLPAPRVEPYSTMRGGAVLGCDPRVRLLTPGSPEWWDAPDDQKTAGLLVLAEAWLVTDPERQVRQRLRSLSWDLSEAMRGRRGGPSHAELTRRRAQPGPVHSFDPAAAVRWVATGSSDGEVPAA